MLKVGDWLETYKIRSKCPVTRRKFEDRFDRIHYLRAKIMHWYYGEQDIHQARKFCRRFQYLLKKKFGKHDDIFGERCWALLYEVKGNIDLAIKYREHACFLMRYKHRLIDILELCEEKELLAINYYDNRRIARAVELLQDSRKLCEKYGLTFEGAELLRCYIKEVRDRKNEK